MKSIESKGITPIDGGIPQADRRPFLIRVKTRVERTCGVVPGGVGKNWDALTERQAGKKVPRNWFGCSTAQGCGTSRAASASLGNPFREHFWETGGENLFLRFGNVVIDPPEDDELGTVIVDRVAGAGIAISRLAYRPDVDEVFRVCFEFDGFSGDLADFVGFHIDPRHVGVAVETDLSELVGKVRHGVEAVRHIIPMYWLIEGAMHDGVVGNLADHTQALEPEALIVIELIPRPLQGGGCDRIHGVERVVLRGVLIVVSLDGRAIEIPDAVQTGDWVCVVAHDITKADEVGDVLAIGICHDGFKGFEIGMYVAENCGPH